MFFNRIEDRTRTPLDEWVLENKADIRAGTASYMDTPISETTEFQRFKYVVSLGIVTISFTTPHFLPTEANGHLVIERYKYAVLTMLAGWWAFPWGPLLTVEALVYTLGGSGKRTAASLLQLLEHGWDAPVDAATNAHRKHLLTLTNNAVLEIRRRMANSGFSPDLAVRISPGNRKKNEVAVAFDYPVSDGRDWTDESQGLLLLIDKNDEGYLMGRHIEFQNGSFVALISED